MDDTDPTPGTGGSAAAVMLWTRAAIGLAPKQRRGPGTLARRPKTLPGAVAVPRGGSGMGSDYLSRQEALAILGVKRQTLYSYVSRGLIRSLQHPDGQESLYLREDLERVKAKSTARSGHGPAAAAAMHWGEPVIITAITEITPQGPRYRQHLALELARSGCSFEATCDLLWQGQPADEPEAWDRQPVPPAISEMLAATLHTQPEAHILQLLTQACLTLGMLERQQPDNVSVAQTVLTGRRLVRTLTGVFGFVGPQRSYVAPLAGESVTRWLARALGLPLDTERQAALQQLLVLVADHELNPATFAARIAASSGSHLPACVAAGFNVHHGIALGCDQLETLFSERCAPGALLGHISDQLAAGRKLRGFNHQLYPKGDPRTRLLIELAQRYSVDPPWSEGVVKALADIERRYDTRPSIEAGLAIIARAIGLPPQAAGGLFALSRTAGWVAHVIEQREAGFMIRPRAKFTGAVR